MVQTTELPKIVKALKDDDKAVSQAAMLSMRRLLIFFLDKGDLKGRVGSVWKTHAYAEGTHVSPLMHGVYKL